ncbi:hypothetical protein RQP53_20940 [Paucibacter sp. APW11]|uniref:DUF2147 domain-containing protein n=1 Tax=Roseateles aquae TaxID=3077235 RepID=A0ABU3PIC1_9BURK|nr:hypothetical protein [Paucibacter sp. APW11]MDT9001756.1 hypothetical protein [Paucibacter sp. APW11]
MRRLTYAVAVLLAVLQGEAIAADMSGTWEYNGPAESGMWLKTKQEGSTLRFQLELQRGAPSYNSGWIDGELELRRNIGVFRKVLDYGGTCEIGFQFSPEYVELRQLGDVSGCGFGHNVYADGVLRRKTHSSPKFSNGDPRFGS